MAQRFDYGTLEKPRKTPQGGVRAPAFLTKSGVFKYDGPNGPISEYRPPDEVFSEASLETLPGAPLTSGHPSSMVSPDNFSDHSVGHVGDEVKQDGDRVAAHVFIQDRRAIKAIEKGQREISCGYTCRIDETPGLTPEGERYDRVQRDIRYNHVALVGVGRAGSDIRLRLDAAGNQQETDDMKVERIDGVEYEIGSDAFNAACKRRDEAEADKAKKLADAGVIQARLDASEAKLAEIQKQLEEATDVKRIDGLVAERVRLVGRARKVLGEEIKLDGLSAREIQELAVKKAAPQISLEGRSDDAISALFDAFATAERADSMAHAQLRVDAHHAQTTTHGDFMKDARRNFLIDRENAWKKTSDPKES